MTLCACYTMCMWHCVYVTLCVWHCVYGDVWLQFPYWHALVVFRRIHPLLFRRETRESPENHRFSVRKERGKSERESRENTTDKAATYALLQGCSYRGYWFPKFPKPFWFSITFLIRNRFRSSLDMFQAVFCLLFSCMCNFCLNFCSRLRRDFSIFFRLPVIT